ncbi:hypothetical protein SUGI_1466920 [Cryptomeria japonica]|nr:hypothetical protein SUGI_1466920 [Cryptomeria japonica]
MGVSLLHTIRIIIRLIDWLVQLLLHRLDQQPYMDQVNQPDQLLHMDLVELLVLMMALLLLLESTAAASLTKAGALYIYIYNAHLSLRLHLDMELLFTNDSHLTIRSSALALSSFAVGFAAFPGTFIAESTAASTERAGSRSSVQSTEEIAGSTTGSTATSAASRTGLEMTG